MPISSTEKAMCSSLDKQYNTLIAPLLSGKSSHRHLLSGFTDSLRKTTFSPGNVINDALSDLQSQANDLLPSSEIAELNKIKDFINNCPLLEGMNPVAAMIGAAGGILDAIDGFINNISITVPEFGLGALADVLDNLMSGSQSGGGLNLRDLFKKLDQLINCLSALCPNSDVSNKLDELNSLYTDYNVIDDPLNPNYGNINYNALYSKAGLLPHEIQNIESVKNTIKSVKSEAISASKEAANKLKLLF